jgi:hypothetical protein
MITIEMMFQTGKQFGGTFSVPLTPAELFRAGLRGQEGGRA